MSWPWGDKTGADGGSEACLHRSLGSLSGLAYGPSRSSHFPQPSWTIGARPTTRSMGGLSAPSNLQKHERGAHERGCSQHVCQREFSAGGDETNILMTCSGATASTSVPSYNRVPILFRSRNRKRRGKADVPSSEAMARDDDGADNAVSSENPFLA